MMWATRPPPESAEGVANVLFALNAMYPHGLNAVAWLPAGDGTPWHCVCEWEGRRYEAEASAETDSEGIDLAIRRPCKRLKEASAPDQTMTVWDYRRNILVRHDSIHRAAQWKFDNDGMRVYWEQPVAEKEMG